MNKDLLIKFKKVNICIIRNKNKILIKKIKNYKKILMNLRNKWWNNKIMWKNNLKLLIFSLIILMKYYLMKTMKNLMRKREI